MVHVRRGIKQGCPTSVLLRALLLDPLPRRLIAVAVWMRATLFFLEEVIASGIRDNVCGLNMFLLEPKARERAASLRLNLAKHDGAELRMVLCCEDAQAAPARAAQACC